MKVRSALLVTALALFAGLLWYAPLGILMPMALENSGGQLSGNGFSGPWHAGNFSLVCHSASGQNIDCGRYQLDTRIGLNGVTSTATSSSGFARWQGWRNWHGEFRSLRLPAKAAAIALPFAEQMRLDGQVQVDGQLRGTGSTIDELALDVRWRGQIYEFPFAEQVLKVSGGGGQISLRWQPVDATPRFEGGIDCSLAGHCRGLVFVQTDGSDEDLARFLAAGGRREAGDANRFAFEINVR